MRLGILGGSFNPPHLAHLIGAEIAMTELTLDRILFIPASIPPHKIGHDLPTPERRLEMVKLAIQDNDKFEVSDIELRRDGPSYTVDTLNELRKLYPDATLTLIIGLDNLEIFASWYKAEEIMQMAEIAVMVRPGYSTEGIDQTLLKMVRSLEIPLLAISGTEIRARVRQRKSIRYQVTEAVRRYIEHEGLYIEHEGLYIEHQGLYID